MSLSQKVEEFSWKSNDMENISDAKLSNLFRQITYWNSDNAVVIPQSGSLGYGLTKEFSP